jgi:F-type H+-transporting ATPase subunit a
MVDLTMSAEANALTPGEYIRHHLQHLQVPQKQNGIVDFSVINHQLFRGP